MRNSHSRTINNEVVSCTEMSAYDSLILLPKVLEIFDENIISKLGSKEFEVLFEDDENISEFLLTLEELKEDFFDDLFEKSKTTVNKKRVSSSDFEDLFSFFRSLVFTIKSNYTEGLKKERVELPKELQNADKIIKNALKAKQSETDDSEPMHHFNAEGVLAKNIPPWLFLVVCSIDKNKRVDWQLLMELKTNLSFADFIDIYLVLESAKSYETAQTLNSL